MSSNNLDENPPDVGRNVQNPRSENIATVPENYAFASFVSESQSEKIHSGESLFKTFVFDQCATGAEIDKCKTFWESVMKKKLEPIKCSIMKKAEMSTENTSICKKQIEKAVEQVHLQYKKLWSDMLQEVKRRKLDEMKLVGKRKCMFCSSLHPPKCGKPYKENFESKNNENIKKLNCWKTSTDQVCGMAGMDVVDEGNTTECARNTDDEETTVPSVPTSKYEFVNIIDERKRDNYYSRWREQSIKCNCGQENCSCKQVAKQDSMPVIKHSIMSESESSLKAECEGQAEEKRNSLDDHSQVHFCSMVVDKIGEQETNRIVSWSEVAQQREHEMEAYLVKSVDETNVPSTDDAEKVVMFTEVEEKLYLTPSHTKPAGRRGMSILKLPSPDSQNMLNEISKKGEQHQPIGSPVGFLTRKDSLEVTRQRTTSRIEFPQYTGSVPTVSHLIMSKDSADVTSNRKALHKAAKQHTEPHVSIASLIRKDSLEVARERTLSRTSQIGVQQYTEPPEPIASLIMKDSLDVGKNARKRLEG